MTKKYFGTDGIRGAVNSKKISCGIVTNKHSKFVKKILTGLLLDTKIDCLITGDMVSEPKPSSEGLLEASRLTGVDPAKCIYVGDDERDIIAGRNAGMYTVAADFGFINTEHDVELWNANKIIKDPCELLSLII